MTSPLRVTRLTGVYDAEGSLLGELRYVVGHALGRRHCALCEVTHGRLREKPTWREAREQLPVPFAAVHLDEQDPSERAVADGRTPCVLAHTAGGVELLLGSEEIERCGGEPGRFVEAIRRALADRGAP
jgi:hypothetical protein